MLRGVKPKEVGEREVDEEARNSNFAEGKPLAQTKVN